MKYFFRYNIYYVLIFPYGIYLMEYFFRCNGNFIIHMENILHEIDSIWKNYYIIKFPRNKYYAGTNISSQQCVLCIYIVVVYLIYCSCSVCYVHFVVVYAIQLQCTLYSCNVHYIVVVYVIQLQCMLCIIQLPIKLNGSQYNFIIYIVIRNINFNGLMSFFLQDKHNINTVSLMIYFMCIRLRSKKKTIWTAP